jgi:hypothetical protein
VEDVEAQRRFFLKLWAEDGGVTVEPDDYLE